MSRDLKEVKERVPGFPRTQTGKHRDCVYLTSHREAGVLVAKRVEARWEMEVRQWGRDAST